MIERATGCLEHGRRALSRLRPRVARSQRALHSAFWSHGAGDIDLPSWWIALLQHPPPDQPDCTQTVVETAKNCLKAGLLNGSFLDFLYPAKTLSLIHKFAIRDAAVLQSRTKRRASQISYRAYNSEAAEVQTVLESDMGHASALLSSIHSQGFRPTDAIDGLEASTHQAYAERFHSLQERLIAYNETLATRRKVEEHMQHVTQAERDVLIHVLQERFESISDDGQKLIHDQSVAILELFEDMLPNKRLRKHYDAALSASLFLNKMDLLLDIYREAVKAGHAPGLTTPVFLRLVERRLWTIALEVWTLYHHNVPLTSLDTLVFQPSLMESDMNALFEAGTSLLKFVKEKCQESGLQSHKNLAVLGETFARALLRRKVIKPFSTVQQYSLLKTLLEVVEPSMDIFSDAISQAQAVESNSDVQATFGHYAFELFQSLRAHYNLSPNRTFVDAMIIRSCNDRLMTDAQALFDYHKTEFGKPREQTFKELVRCAAFTADSSHFFSLFNEYKATWGRHTSPMIHNLVLVMYARRGEYQKLVNYFNSLESEHGLKPDARIYRTLIAASARLRDLRGARRWYAEMTEQGIAPDRKIVSEMMIMHALRGDLQTVQELFDNLKSHGLSANISHYTSLVQALVKTDKIEEAEKVLRITMTKNLGSKGSRLRVWNFVLHGYAQRRDLATMRRLHKEMEDAGIQSNGQTFGALMQGLCLANQPMKAWKVMKDVFPENHIERAPRHYAILMGGFLKSKMYSNVLVAYEEMVKMGIKPNLNVQNALMEATVALEHNHNGQRLPHGQESVTNLSITEEILNSSLESLDADGAGGPEPGSNTKAVRLNESDIASYFIGLMRVYSHDKNLSKVADLYARYLEVSRKIHPDTEPSPPLNMISILMLFHRLRHAHEEVENCWYLASEKAEHLSKRPNADKSAGNWVVPAFKDALNEPLFQYMMSLYTDGRAAEVALVVDDLVYSGYELDSKCWNLFVNLLLASKQWSGAFEVCERELMRNFTASDYISLVRQSSASKRRANTLAGPRLSNHHQRTPALKTLRSLWKAVQKLRITRPAEADDENSVIKRYARNAPKTMLALNLIYDESASNEILGNVRTKRRAVDKTVDIKK